MILDESNIMVILWLLFFLFIFQIVLIFLFVVFFVQNDTEDSVRSSRKNKQLKKDMTVTDYNQSKEVVGKTIQTISCSESQQDEYCQGDNSQRSGIQKDQPLFEPKIVINRKSEYKPEKLDEAFYFGNKEPNPQNDERHYLILEKYAFKKLIDFLDWGTNTERNRVEQGGVLLGHIAYYNKEIYCIVNDVLLANTIGSPVFVEFTSEMWACMQNELVEINSTINKNEQLVIVGWFHTHPNELSVFMSGTDMRTQQLNFSEEWQVSLVMNPHMNKYRVFFGAKATEGKVVLPRSEGEYYRSIGGYY